MCRWCAGTVWGVAGGGGGLKLGGEGADGLGE